MAADKTDANSIIQIIWIQKPPIYITWKV